MKIVKRLLWAADAVLAVLVVVAAAGVLAESGAAGREQDQTQAWVEKAPDPLSQPLTDAEAQQMLSSGTIVPVPPRPSPPPQPAVSDTTPQPVDPFANFAYKLIGTAVEENFAWAFFADRSGVQTGKGQGENIGGAAIIGIWEDRVLVEMNGQRKEIYIEKQQSSPTPVQVASVRPSPRIPADLPPAIAAAAAVEDGDDGADEGDADEEEEDEFDEFDDLDWDVISEDQYKDYILNVGKYISEIVILVHYDEEKKPDGLLLSKVPKTSEAYKRGLRQGDIVTKLQDTPVTDTTTAFRVASQVLKDEDYFIDVTVIRDGQEEELSYEIWPE